TDDAMSLTLIISGEGNIQLINAPDINWQKHFEVFDAKRKDDIDQTAVPMKGTRTFTFPFVVDKVGNYTIDSISFSYFDPSINSYKTVQTNPIEITVNKGSNSLKNHNLLNKTSPNNHNGSYFGNFNIEILALIGLLILIVVFILFAKFKRANHIEQLEKEKQLDELKNKWEKAQSEFTIPENPLLGAHEALMRKDSKQFFQVLHTSFKKYLSVKLNIPLIEMNKKTLNEKLDSCNVGIRTSFLLNDLLEEIELNLYAKPAEYSSLDHIYEKAGEVVSLLNKQIC
ncbi:MAG: BatD family protein, partial [Ginsengibacter sp.]